MIKIEIPNYVSLIQQRLINAGYECYLVGGCVRDALLGLKSKDYDLTTNCEKDVLKELFSDYHIINNNGEKHNTITLHTDNDNIEITAFKHDENEPNNLISDLSHRDLTINAMAYNGELIDFNGGYNDLMNKVIKCVGNPEDRIIEDPLRILRILRFASKLDFLVDESTKIAIEKYVHLLKNVSPERIKVELDGIFSGKNIKSILMEYKDVLFQILPELKRTYNFDQRNPYHSNTLFIHTVNVCSSVNNNPLLRMAALLHDVAKPLCMTVDENGIGHFYGHADLGCGVAEEILKRLKYSNDEINNICYLIKFHDSNIILNKKSIKKNFMHTPNQDEQLFFMLIELMNADKGDHTIKQLTDLNAVKEIVTQIKEENECMKLSDLKLNGYDMMTLGYQGKNIGLALDYLLTAVVDEKVNNVKEELIAFLDKEYKKEV